VGNLSFRTDGAALRAAFEQYGAVSDVHLVTDRESGQPRGFGFVTMGTDDAAQAAISGMNGKDLDGRTLRVNEAEDRSSGASRQGGGGGKRARW
jgi:RNA recognition motif-containing protein